MIEKEDFNFKPVNFIQGYRMTDTKLCDDLIHYFKTNKDLHERGVVGNNKGPKIDVAQKDSIDIGITPEKFKTDLLFNNYWNHLDLCLKQYLETFTHLNNGGVFGLIESVNIQYYKPGGGFKFFHTERQGPNNNRVLVFMTYLNDVSEGGTEFPIQNIITKCKKGLTLIWPTDWTHTHRGIVSNTEEKFIITGWLNYF